MAKKSFWRRGEDYAQKDRRELIEQIKRGDAPWRKPWKPGELLTRISHRGVGRRPPFVA